MFPFLIKSKNLLLDILFPPFCLNCQRYLERSENYICAECFNLIKFNHTLFCPICRARLAENKKICHRQSQYLLAAAGNYEDPVLQNIIYYFKYQSFENLAPILGEILIKYLNSLNSQFSILNFLVVPIPLHRLREKERGFNQAKLLAKIIADRFDLTLAEKLKRIKNNEPQAKLKDHNIRIKNIANCFKTESPEFFEGKNVLLIDDVFTSGATMSEAVKILKESGAKRIIALVLAKAS